MEELPDKNVALGPYRKLLKASKNVLEDIFPDASADKRLEMAVKLTDMVVAIEFRSREGANIAGLTGLVSKLLPK